MQQFLITISLLFTGIIIGQNSTVEDLKDSKNVTVSVINTLSDKGNVVFALYNKEGFRKESIDSKSAKIENGISKVVFSKVPKGEYAVICFHDENSNKRMDFELNGMPKENYGASNNALSFGPPQFEPAKFEVRGNDLNLEIKF